jgi:hypothetical protein
MAEMDENGRATIRDVYNVAEQIRTDVENTRREVIGSLESFKVAQSARWEAHDAFHRAQLTASVQEYILPLRDWQRDHSEYHDKEAAKTTRAWRWSVTTLIALLALIGMVINTFRLGVPMAP